MKIIIAGGGRVGQYLAKELSQHGHDLVMIERNKKSADRAGDMFDISVINADACDMGALRKAAMSQA